MEWVARFSDKLSSASKSEFNQQPVGVKLNPLPVSLSKGSLGFQVGVN
jgi:hypothetical protein